MKLLFVTNNPNMSIYIEKFIKDYLDMFQHEYSFTSIDKIFHLDNQIMKFREHNGKIYYNKKEQGISKKCYLKLNDIDIPNHTYICFPQDNLIPIEDFSIFDKIIGVFNSDSNESILGFKKFTEIYHLKNTYFYFFKKFTYKEFYKLLKLKKIENFENIFQKTKKDLINNNFKCNHNCCNILMYLQQESNLNDKDFASFVGMPYNTFKKYQYKDIPSYIYKLIEYKLEKEGFFYPL